MLQLIAVILIIAADQLTKLAAIAKLAPRVQTDILPGIFSLRYVENRGAAFSMLQGQTLLLTVVPILASAVIVYVLITRRVKSKIGTWGLALILAGALGNLIDRVFRGFVVDMFDFCLINFPVFNVADIAVTVGAVFFFIYVLFIYDGKDSKDRE